MVLGMGFDLFSSNLFISQMIFSNVTEKYPKEYVREEVRDSRQEREQNQGSRKGLANDAKSKGMCSRKSTFRK